MEYKGKIMALLEKVNDEYLLGRIYNFVYHVWLRQEGEMMGYSECIIDMLSQIDDERCLKQIYNLTQFHWRKTAITKQEGGTDED